MFFFKCTIPMGPNVVPLTACTHSVFIMMSTSSMIFMKGWYEIQEHVALVLNRDMIRSQS